MLLTKARAAPSPACLNGRAHENSHINHINEAVKNSSSRVTIDENRDVPQLLSLTGFSAEG